MNHDLSRRQLIAGALAGGALSSVGAAGAGRVETILFRDISLVDGTGAQPRPADVLVAGDRIVRIAAPSRRAPASGGRIVEGAGRVLAPGFIDLHSHGDPLRSSYQSFLAMGVTTITLGQDGDGPGPGLDSFAWRKAVESAPLDINIA